MRRILAAACLPAIVLLAGCSGAPTIPVAKEVDLDRFMGDWYVIANIPTRFEVGAHNAVESYRLDKDGSIATTFTYREGAFDGPEKVMHPAASCAKARATPSGACSSSGRSRPST